MLDPPQPKRQHVTDQHGWTHIVSRQNRGYRPPQGPLKPASIPPGLTLEAIKRSAERYRRSWKESLCFRTFAEHFEKEVLPSIHVTINRCICLGLGSITGGRCSEWWELVALESILEMLRTKNAVHDIYVQDPVFNALDVAFMRSLGYTVVQDPVAFDLITRQSLLFVPHLEFDVFARALETADPVVCIGSDLDGFVNRIITNDEEKRERETAIFQRYLNVARQKPLPDFERDTWCTFTCIYWVGDLDEMTTL